MEEGFAFLRQLEAPYVLKADGLAAGKGVLILADRLEAEKELQHMLAGKFGKASRTVVIEEFLNGIELSCFVITDGNSYKILPSAKDYKRIGEKDTGPNTGGMGAVSPVVFADKSFMEKVETQIIAPTIQGLQQDRISYKGFIFFGLMNVQGNPFVIEYNVRLGDPETECILPRIKSDFGALLQACADGTLEDYRLETDDRAAVTVMLVSGGYPGDYSKGKIISGLNAVAGCLVFHAGTSVDVQSGNVKTSGGRVIAVTAMGYTMEEAKLAAVQNACKIRFDGAYFRADIADDLLNYRLL
jgi:phosphoribosylamine--glycine ligase